MTLFKQDQGVVPLAERMRPHDFAGFEGQADLVAEGRVLRDMVDRNTITSMILWGPPGSGKTTLARIIAEKTVRPFLQFSAVTSGIAEIKKVMAQAETELASTGRNVILFMDEIHRFNKAQQDAFLPYIESGTVILIGATTENPSFELNAPLLSRCQVYILKELTEEDLGRIAERALADTEHGLGGRKCTIDDDARAFLAATSGGDARTCLNRLEIATERAGKTGRITLAAMREAVKRENIYFDNKGEHYYNTISAFHKSLRGSDVQAALFWLARMLESGQDPLYVARRMVRFASEDIGVADPEALVMANAVKEAVHFLGMPEANTALSQGVIYLATAPKSNSAYVAYKGAAKAVHDHPDAAVPLHIRNAPTDLMEKAGYGKGYVYEHDTAGHLSAQEFLPDKLRGSVFYEPGQFGFEKEIRKRLDYWKTLKTRLQNEQDKKTDLP
ncbi:MAG: replication-associated recombination protein A [Planctomycetota bacterium]